MKKLIVSIIPTWFNVLAAVSHKIEIIHSDKIYLNLKRLELKGGERINLNKVIEFKTFINIRFITIPKNK